MGYTSFTFCQGCNEKFDLESAGAPCPHCGVDLVPLDLASTAYVDEIIARESLRRTGRTDDEEVDSLVGSRLGCYNVEKLVGRGGMARVYRARHGTLQRSCALKVLNPKLAEKDRGYVDLFFNEARSAASLVHPDIVTIHNVGSESGAEGERHFIEMEYVDGRSLQAVADSEGPMEAVRATNFTRCVARALARAHRLDLIHRDLKPANVLVARDGATKLADFGLAKKVVSGDFDGSRIVGTPHFMAPEIFGGRPATKRSDVYSLGVMYFYLLTGRLPFVDSSVKRLARKHAEEPVPDVSALAKTEIPDELDVILQRCLAKRAADRYPDGDALHEELRAVFGNLRRLEELLSEALEGLDLDWRAEGDSAFIELRLKGGRRQKVFVEASSSGPMTRRVVRIYSIAAPVLEGYFLRALELNADLPFNSIAVRKIDGKSHFIMTQTYPRATCDPEEVRHSVLSVARWADAVEAQLTGKDEF